MTVQELVEKLAEGELDADAFNKRLEEEARAAAEAAAKEAAARDAQERSETREEARVLTEETAELSPAAERELEESKGRIKKAADKARHI